MLGAVLARRRASCTAIAPSIGDQFGELRPRAEDGLRQATDVLADPPFNLSETRDPATRVDEAIARLRENSGPLARGLSSGAVILGEVLTGLIVTVLLTFFFLKDGARMWGYLLSFTGAQSRARGRARGPASTPRSPATSAGSRSSASSTRS